MSGAKRETVSAKRVAVISCIHGNMEALEATLDDIAGQSVDQTIGLGDLVGYGPHPNEVVKTFIDRNIRSVQGCWDEGIALGNDSCGCQFLTDEDEALGGTALRWTAEACSKETKDYLKKMTHGMRMETPAGLVAFVHGSPRSNSEYLAESTHDLVLLERTAGAGCDVLVCGHTHIPFVRRIDGTIRVTAKAGIKDAYYRHHAPVEDSPSEIILSPKLVINAGSVGEPRHGTPESTYIIFDTETLDVEIRRVKYAVEKTVKAMRKKNLPESFMERLLVGTEFVGKNKEIVCAC